MEHSPNIETFPMKQRVARINGIKTHLEALSDEELENHMSYAHQRVEDAVHDLETLGIESALRFALAEEIGETAMADVVQLFNGQGVLFTPDDAA